MRKTEDIAEKFAVNDEQAQALDFTENTALRASAGSGKTRVLTKRFVRILLEETDADLNDIIAITFTRKAATEMKGRIRRELAAWLKKPQYAQDRRLTDFRFRMSEARIDTIHGFLGKLIRESFQVLGIDPGFTILEEVDAKVLTMRFIDASIRSIFDDPLQKDRLVSCMTLYGADIGESPLRDAVFSLYQGMRCTGETVHTIKERYRAYETGTTPSMGIRALEHIGLDLLDQLDKRFRAYKDMENVLDFSDLELLACDLLERPASCRSIRDSFRHLMMDEFQDVNPLQMRLVNLLTRDENGAVPPGRLFIVGDSKQSIYGFRGADHRVFGATCDIIARQGTARHLSMCYRCTDTIIQTVNHLFSRLMSAYEPLQLPREKSGRPVELITWTSDDRKILKPSSRWVFYKELIPDGSPEDADTVLRAPYRESVETNRMMLQGKVIAGRMAALNAEGTPYRDMAILVPSRSSLSAIENALYSKNIPYCVLGGLGFWSRTEISDILNLYRLIFQPQDRVALYAVLRSPLFSFSDDLLLRCRQIDRESKEKALRPEVLLECLARALSGDDALSDAAALPDDDVMSDAATLSDDAALRDAAVMSDEMLSARAAGVFKSLLPLDGILGPSELFQTMLQTSGYAEILLLLPKGEKKIRNLEKLVQVVNEFSRKHGYTARDLPLYLDALQESGGMDSEAFLDNEDSEAVKILTIHASKGLEFPVVFLPSMDRAVDAIGSRFKPFLVLHPDNGLAAIGADENQNISPALNLPYQEVFNARLARELEESRRVFYVAATRAQSLLVMVGEHQPAKDGGLNAQNSFMKQLSWALSGCAIPDSLRLLDAEKFLGCMPDPPDLQKTTDLNHGEDAEGSGTGSTAPLSMPVHRPSGLASVSQWMSWRDCPRQYWLSRLIRIPGQADVQVFEEASRNPAQDADGISPHASFPEDPVVPSQDATGQLADQGPVIDASRLGTWVHAQLQDIPLDRSGLFPVLGQCSLDDARIPRWLESQREHALHLLDGYNRIIKDGDLHSGMSVGSRVRSAGNPASSWEVPDVFPDNSKKSEKLVHSWNEFEFRIRASDSLELIGVIDRLDIVETQDGFRAVIIDYKSNHIQDELSMLEKAAYYAIQLQVYAWAVSRMPIWRGKPAEPIRGELYFLDAGKSVTVPIGHDEQIVAIESLIRALPDLLGLLNQEGYPMKEGDACTWCQQKPTCEMLKIVSCTCKTHHK